MKKKQYKKIILKLKEIIDIIDGRNELKATERSDLRKRVLKLEQWMEESKDRQHPRKTKYEFLESRLNEVLKENSELKAANQTYYDERRENRANYEKNMGTIEKLKLKLEYHENYDEEWRLRFWVCFWTSAALCTLLLLTVHDAW